MNRHGSFFNLITDRLENQAIDPCLCSSATFSGTTGTSTPTTRPETSGPGFALERMRLL